MERRTAIGIVVLMACLITLVSIVGLFFAVYWDNDAPLMVVVIATAVISFVSLLVLTQSDKEQWDLTEGSMRTAIAGTVIIVYLVLVGLVAFFKVGPEKLPAISQTLVTSFTTIVGVVVAFYFGASAYIQASTERKEGGTHQ